MSRRTKSIRRRGAIFTLLVWIGFPPLAELLRAQGQKSSPTPAPTKSGVVVPSPKIYATLAQLMRGTLYPASNLIFFAQDQDPDKVPQAKDPSTATDPLASSYGKWQAIENGALAIAEVANLLTIPGRKCSNGRDAPINNPDWPGLVQGLRDAGMAAYKAAQSKSEDNMLMVAETISTACGNCHDKYREKPSLADRCK